MDDIIIRETALNWKSKIPFLSLSLISFLFSCKQEGRIHSEKPNILFIVTDDQGPWTISAQSHANAFTPNLDELASKGVLFTRAYSVSAVCSPSRASLISGLYPTETGVGDWLVGSNGIDSSLILWPEMLSDAGYQTAMVGKWHIGHAEEHYHPTHNGFQRFSGWPGGSGKSKDPVVMVEGMETMFEGEYTPDVLTDLTINYIREFKSNPWVISLNYWAPHANTRFPEGFRPAGRGRSWLPMKEEDLEYWQNIDVVFPDPDFPDLDVELLDRMTREYHSSVHSVDRNIGRLMKYLEELDMIENTIVIFTSDHGFNMGHNGIWHKGNGRWLTKDERDPAGIYVYPDSLYRKYAILDGRPNLYDNSLRVPMIIRWPGQTQEGAFIDEIVTHLDLYPTLLEMAGIKKPDDLLLRGSSLAPLLKGSDIDWDNTFFAQLTLPKTNSLLRSIQTKEWKYVHDFADSTKYEFYNMADDPRENNNLIDNADPFLIGRRESMRNRLLSRLWEINDPVLQYLRTDKSP